jgi:uncharacterized protein (DUF1778 family)
MQGDYDGKDAIMLAFDDKAGQVPERSTERMNFRTKPHIKRAIQRAAALSGVDDSVFTINAAYQAAIETIASHERTQLQAADHEAFFAALDNPPEPTDRLRQAAERYHATISTR